METRVLQLFFLLIICSVCAVVETTVALPIMTITVVTAQFSRKLYWTHAVFLAALALVLSAVYQLPWYLVYLILLLIPALATVRAQTIGQGSMPLPLLLSISTACVVLLSVVAGSTPTLGTVVYTLLSASLGYVVLYLLRLRQQRRRFVEWFWVSA